MGFYADPDAIDVLACRVAEWGEDCDLARDYNDRYSSSSNLTEAGLLRGFAATMDSVQWSVAQALLHLRSVTVNSAAELFATADYYRDGDAATVARLDATLPFFVPTAVGPKPV